MESGLQFDHLSAVEFEQLCSELLHSLGATSVQWRRGTSLPASPADQGRDIECTFMYKIPGGEHITERRFVECKHYIKGVPPQALEGALSWAAAERPESLYFMVSGFLSNPAKEYLRTYQSNNRPYFRIVVWERPELQRQLETHAHLITKYRLSSRPLQLDLMHPAHLEFATRGPLLVEMNSFFRIVDNLSPYERNRFFSTVIYAVGQESYSELAGYSIFKKWCFENELPGFFLVHSLVSFALHTHFSLGNYTRAEGVKDTQRDFVEFLQKRANENPADSAALLRMIERVRCDIEEVEERLRRQHADYLAFCDRVLQPLLNVREPPPDPSEILSDV